MYLVEGKPSSEADAPGLHFVEALENKTDRIRCLTVASALGAAFRKGVDFPIPNATLHIARSMAAEHPVLPRWMWPVFPHIFGESFNQNLQSRLDLLGKQALEGFIDTSTLMREATLLSGHDAFPGTLLTHDGMEARFSDIGRIEPNIIPFNTADLVNTYGASHAARVTELIRSHNARQPDEPITHSLTAFSGLSWNIMSGAPSISGSDTTDHLGYMDPQTNVFTAHIKGV